MFWRHGFQVKFKVYIAVQTQSPLLIGCRTQHVLRSCIQFKDTYLIHTLWNRSVTKQVKTHSELYETPPCWHFLKMPYRVMKGKRGQQQKSRKAKSLIFEQDGGLVECTTPPRSESGRAPFPQAAPLCRPLPLSSSPPLFQVKSPPFFLSSFQTGPGFCRKVKGRHRHQNHPPLSSPLP